MHLRAPRPSRPLLTAAALAWAALVFLVLVPAVGSLMSGPEHAGPTSAATPLGRRLAAVRLMDYYPSTAAWTYMWTDWNPQLIGDDFARIRALGANTVRLNIQPGTFGFPVPEATMTGELGATIRAATAHALDVQLTLFDWWSAYTDTGGSDEWAADLLAPYRNDPRIAFIDVKNEIDPDDAQAMSWLAHELPVVRRAAGSVPVTVSVAGPDLLAGLAAVKSRLAAAPPDFYDVHYYAAPQLALATFEAAKALVAPAPLFVGETGATTGQGGAPAVAEAQQDLYLRTVEWAARAAGLPDAAPWILQDIAADGTPPSADRSPEALDYGLYRLDGTPKPAAASLRALYQDGAISTSVNGAFSVGAGSSAADWSAVRTGGAQVRWSGTGGRDGGGYLQLGATGTAPDGDPAFTAAPVVQPSAAGGAFELTAWAEGEQATGSNRIAICWFDASGGYLGESDSPPLPGGTTGWRRLAVASAAPGGAAYELVYLESGGDSGTVRFTDVTVTELT
jgi:hypothetical protein